MDILCEKYRELRLDGSLIGLERADGPAYFCTPVGAEVIGWDSGIHYCFIRGLGDTVFCVNPETCCEHYVYPIARSFRDFLGLILAVGNTNTLQQIILWDKEAYKAFVNSPHERDNLRKSEVRSALGRPAPWHGAWSPSAPRLSMSRPCRAISPMRRYPFRTSTMRSWAWSALVLPLQDAALPPRTSPGD